MLVMVGTYFLAAVACAFLGRTLGSRVFVVVALPMVATVVWAAGKSRGVLDGAAVADSATWVGITDGLALNLSFRLDGFALLMVGLVAGIGLMVSAYSVSYFADNHSPSHAPSPSAPSHAAPGDTAAHPAIDETHPAVDLRLFAAAFVAFAGSMLGLVLANDIVTLFIFWELTSITSFLLIGINDHEKAARQAALRAVLVTGGGGLALLAGLVILAQRAGSTEITAILADAPRGAAVNVAVVLVLLGALTKSAQFPFHFWLPGAMKAPTPVSAYLHSATMVKAGIVLIARFAPSFADTPPWRPIIVVCGLASVLWGGIRALRQTDAKLALAHGTVSQLGFLVLLVGIGVPIATYAGVAMLLAHAIFKAPLFLAVGVVDHQLHTREFSRLGGLAKKWPLLAAASACAAISMAGLPPMLGFATKEKALAALVDSGLGWRWPVIIAVVAGSALTFAYSARWWLLIFGPRKQEHSEPIAEGPRPSTLFVLPIAILGFASLVLGVLSGAVGKVVADFATSLDAQAAKKLALWAGVNTALLLTGVVIIGGLLVMSIAASLQRRRGLQVSGENMFDRTYNGVIGSSRRLTGVVQSGSLPTYVLVSAIVVLAVLTFAMLSGMRPDMSGVVLANSPAQFAVAVLAAGMTIGAAMVPRRFAAVMLLGGVGYAMAAIFMMHGAPDLALTQLLVETLSIVVFLLALRDLPDTFAAPKRAPSNVGRLVLCAAVGIGVTFVALTAGTQGAGRSPTVEYEQLSEKAAGGRNVVNVILVDFRGADTMGEITVLSVAAIGVANLAAAVRRTRRNQQARQVDPFNPPNELRRTSSSVILDQVSHAVFPVILLFSLFLTFRGHNAPGGGFAGGLVVGGGLAIRYLAGGTASLGRLTKIPSTLIIGIGLMTSVLTALVPLVVGNSFLESSIYNLDLPVIGKLKVVSAALFDLGVYVVVIGVVLAIVTQLGDHRSPPELSSEPEPAIAGAA